MKNNKHTLTYTIIKINVVVFLLDQFIPVASSLIRQLGMFNVESLVNGQVWRLLTFQFIHGSSQDFSGALLHLAFNMIGMYYFGPVVERYWGRMRYLAFYLICGIGGAISFMLLSDVFGVQNILTGERSFGGGLVGASAGLFGIFVAMVLINPNQLVSLIFPPTKAFPIKYIIWALITYSIISLFVSRTGNQSLSILGRNAGGEAAHLGGAIMGYLLMCYPTLLNWIPFSLGSSTMNRSSSKQGFYTGNKLKGKTVYEAKIKPKKQVREVTVDQEKLNKILDKVHTKGIHHLTAEEQTFLKRYYADKNK